MTTAQVTDVNSPDTTEVVESSEATETTAEVQPTEPTVPTEAKKDPEKELRQRFAKLGRREQAINAKAAQIDAQLKELEKYKEVDTLVQQGKRLDVLNKLNIQYDDLTRDLISNPRDPAQEKFLELQEQIAELKAERARELERVQQAQATQQEQAARQFVASKVKELNAELIDTIEGGLDTAYSMAIQLLQDGTYSDPVKATEAAVKEVQGYYANQLEKALGTSVGRSYLEKRYEEYTKAKKAEKEKASTLTTRTPTGKVNSTVQSTSPEFEGKGTAKGLKELLKQQRALNK